MLMPNGWYSTWSGRCVATTQFGKQCTVSATKYEPPDKDELPLCKIHKNQYATREKKDHPK